MSRMGDSRASTACSLAVRGRARAQRVGPQPSSTRWCVALAMVLCGSLMPGTGVLAAAPANAPAPG